jgi:hypothetical protein
MSLFIGFLRSLDAKQYDIAGRFTRLDPNILQEFKLHEKLIKAVKESDLVTLQFLCDLPNKFGRDLIEAAFIHAVKLKQVRLGVYFYTTHELSAHSVEHAVMIATKQNDLLTLSYLIEAPQSPVTRSCLEKSFKLAAAKGKQDLVVYYLEQNMNRINPKLKEEMLGVAAGNGDLQMVRCFCQNHPQPSRKAMRYAANKANKQGHSEVVNYLKHPKLIEFTVKVLDVDREGNNTRTTAALPLARHGLFRQVAIPRSSSEPRCSSPLNENSTP